MIICGHCSALHETVAEVRECAVKSGTIRETERVYLEVPFLGKDKAKEFGARWDPEKRAWWVLKSVYEENPLAFQDWVEPSGKKAAPDGYYEYCSDIYRVVKAVHGSGWPYASRLVRSADSEGLPKGEWVRAPGMQFKVARGHKLSLEEQQELGKLYGFCVRCGKTLTNPESIERGMGPVCSGKEI